MARRPMTRFLTGTLTIHQIFARLKADFRSDGKGNVTPTSSFFANPPSGLGYAGPQEFQAGFLNAYVNSRAGKARYNQPGSNDVLVTEINPTKTVGNLVLRIFSDQKK